MSLARKGRTPWNKGLTGIYSEETKMKISIASKNRLHPKGELNPNWKGDSVSYSALHGWIRKNLPESDLCEECHLVPPRDLANVTGIYTRDFNNWKYLCHKCHMIFDLGAIDMSYRKCSRCASSKTRISKSNNRPRWYYLNNKLVCQKCYDKERYYHGKPSHLSSI